MSKVEDAFEAMFDDIERRLDITLQSSRADLSALAAKEADDLALLSLEPGYEKALVYSRNKLAIAAGIAIDDATDAVPSSPADAQALGLIVGGLRLAAILLA